MGHRYRFSFGHEPLPLLKPYPLSFTTLESFDSVWVVAERDDGATGIGEAVPLPGYNHETLTSVRATVGRMVAAADGADRPAIAAICAAETDRNPFAASAVMAAVDLIDHIHAPGFAPRGLSCTVSSPLAATDDLGALDRAVEAAVSNGFRHLKCKVGRDIEVDSRAAAHLLAAPLGPRVQIVFDANQGYTPDEAVEMCRVLARHDRGRLQWFEQPVDRHDWQAMADICRSSPCPIVLDEAIFDEADIRRAAAIGARGVKLKLVKHPGIDETVRLARLAHGLDLTVVMGNGVASDIGNLGELLICRDCGDLLAAPAESTGFLKLASPRLGEGVLEPGEDGSVRCAATAKELRSAIAAYCDGRRAGSSPIHSATAVSR